MKYTHIIWDFNGTILNDVHVGIKSVNTLLAKRGLKIIDSVDYYHEKFVFPIIEYYKNLGFDFNAESYDTLAHEWVAEYLKNSGEAFVYAGVTDTMRSLKEMGYKQIILSATEKSMLTKQIGELGISEYIDEVLGCGDIYAYGKTEIAASWKAENPTAVALMVGDTLHDSQTAAAVGFDCLLVCGGHQSRAVLEDAGVEVIENIGGLLTSRTFNS